jgi:hypothetical protein
MSFSLVCGVIRPPIDCKVIKEFLAAFIGKQNLLPSLYHLENERHRSVNNHWWCIFGHVGGISLQIVRNEVLTAFIGKRESTILPAPS